MRSPRIRIFNAVLLACGLVLLGVLLWRLDLGEVARTMWRARWAVLAAFGIQVAGLVFQSLSWRDIIDPSASRARFGDLLAAFWSGAALNAVTPGSAAGTVLRGTILGGKVDGEEATASLILFTYMATIVNIGFAVAGVTLAVSWLDLTPAVRAGFVAAAAVMCAGGLLLYGVTRWGIAAPALRLLRRIRLRKPAATDELTSRAASVDRRVRRFRAERPYAFARALAYVVVSRVCQVVALWVLLIAVLPDPHVLRWTAAWAGMTYACYQIVGWVGFFVPGRVGVHEGGVALLFELFTLDPATGLSLALLRRTRKLLEVLVGFVIAAVYQSRTR